MKYIKHFALTLALLMLVLCAAGCGSSGTSASEAIGSAAAETGNLG